MRRSAEFARVMRGGARAGTRTVVLHCLLRPDAAPAQVGFVVGRRVGNAVVRNTVRRRLRAVLGQRLATVPAHSSIVVRANPPAAAASFADLTADVDSCLARIARRQVVV